MYIVLNLYNPSPSHKCVLWHQVKKQLAIFQKRIRDPFFVWFKGGFLIYDLEPLMEVNESPRDS